MDKDINHQWSDHMVTTPSPFTLKDAPMLPDQVVIMLKKKYYILINMKKDTSQPLPCFNQSGSSIVMQPPLPC